MNKSRLPFAAFAALAMALSTSCADRPLPPSTSSNAPAATAVQEASDPLAATYARLAEDGARVFKLDPANSSVRIYVFRDGRAARLGHNHVLSAPSFEGFVSLPSTGTADARFDLEFRLDELEIDNAAYRTGLGAAFASVLSADAIEGTREHMLGESNMQAARFPTVRIHSLRISGEAPHLAAQVAVQMHGASRDMWIPLTVTGLPERLSVSGSFVLRQTDFGIHPYSVAGGLLAVKDEVVVDFSLSSR